MAEEPVDRTFRVEYEVNEFGWADIVFSGEDWRIESPVSYTSDPLFHLAWGTLGLFDETITLDIDNVVFDAESGGLRMRVDATNFCETDNLNEFVLKVRLEDIAPDLPNPPLGLPRAFEVTVGDFVREVLRTLEAVYDRHGIVGYHERWLNSDFPLAAMVRLRHEMRLPLVERRLW